MLFHCCPVSEAKGISTEKTFSMFFETDFSKLYFSQGIVNDLGIIRMINSDCYSSGYVSLIYYIYGDNIF